MSFAAERQKVDPFRLDRDQITTVKVLGSGNFGQVSKAVYKPLNSEVAVKSLKGTLGFSNALLHRLMKDDKIIEFKPNLLNAFLLSYLTNS